MKTLNTFTGIHANAESWEVFGQHPSAGHAGDKGGWCLEIRVIGIQKSVGRFAAESSVLDGDFRFDIKLLFIKFEIQVLFPDFFDIGIQVGFSWLVLVEHCGVVNFLSSLSSLSSVS